MEEPDMRIPTRATLSLALAGALVAACSGAAAPQAPVADRTAAAAASTAAPAAATPVPTPKEITPPPASPTPTPFPTTDGQGAEVVRGVETDGDLLTNYTITKVGDVSQYRGGVVLLRDEMNDPRVDGTVRFEFSIDAYDSAASEWGTMKVENKAGSWDGPCTGGTWAEGDGIAWSCWLTGRGAYDGYTYYKQTTKEVSEKFLDIIGVVYPGEPPKER
jgi:hypothetical protein